MHCQNMPASYKRGFYLEDAGILCWHDMPAYSFNKGLGGKVSAEWLWLIADASRVRYAKFQLIEYFIDNDILQNLLIYIDINIDIF